MKRMLTCVALAFVAACGLDDDDHHGVDSDTHDTGGDTGVDTVDDTSADTVPAPPPFLPGVAETRTRQFPWTRNFYVSADGAAILTPVEGLDSTPASRTVELARVDLDTLAMTRGPRLGPGGYAIDMYSTGDEADVWLVDHNARTLRAVTVATLEAGAALQLPASPKLRTATWAGDGTAVAFAHGPDDYDQVLHVQLSDVPSAYDLATAPTHALTIPASSFLRMRLTGDGLIAIGGAPSTCEHATDLCFAEPVVELGFTQLIDLEADSASRLIIDEDAYDRSFRTSASGRWLFRGDGAGRVIALDLEHIGVTKLLPCSGTELMTLGLDDGVICSGKATTRPTGASVFKLDSEASTIAEVDVVAPLITELVASPDMTHAFIGSEIVDFTASPPRAFPIAEPSLPIEEPSLGGMAFKTSIAGPTRVWSYDPLSSAVGVRTYAWSDGALTILPIAQALLGQLEPLPDGGVAVSYLSAFDIEIYAADGTLRGTIHRNLEATPP